MSKKLIYLASPYSHESSMVRNIRAQQISEFGSLLIKMNLIVFSPITYGHEIAKHQDLPTDFIFWETFCLTFLIKCDEMYVYKMDGWDSSIRLKNEIQFCIENSIEIKYIDFNIEHHKVLI